MLERLRISNFQRHRRLDVKLDPRVTTIVGATDTGKSSVLRALRWVATNRPRGDSFVRDGAPGASVRLRVDGHDVRRKRKGRENVYVVDGKEFKAFSSDVPPQVADLLNLVDENFEGQHDSLFWFHLTPGEVARQLNRIVDLAVIDEVMAKIAGGLRKARTEAELLAGRLAKAEAERARLDFVGALDGELSALEDRYAEVARLTALAFALGAAVGKGIEHQTAYERASGAARDGRVVLELGERALDAVDLAESLADLVAEAGKLKAEAGRSVPCMRELDCLRGQAERSAASSEAITLLIESAASCCGEKSAADNRATRAKALVEKETEGICPVCGGPFDGGKIDE